MYYAVSYDLNGYHTEVKNACLNGNFYNRIKKADGKSYALPNTTLLCDATDIANAEKQFRAAVTSVSKSIVIEKLFILPAHDLSNYYLDSDDAI